MTAQFWAALIGALPQILKLLAALAANAAAARARGEGYDQAVKDGLVSAAAGLEAAIAAGNEAAGRHHADPTDAAFDPEFRRD
ncbi:MAG: hypothetical protein IT481_08665 [Gammaproteobacteria bacterium]|nr:hypothetical protein [Gammaproteobacteria bacterium]